MKKKTLLFIPLFVGIVAISAVTFTKNADVKTIFASNPEAMSQIESGDSYTGCVVGGGSGAPEYVLYCGTCDMYHVSRGGDGLCKKQ